MTSGAPLFVDHYAILGVAQNATPDEIRSAYRELSKQHHPDRGGDAETFAALHESYQLLMDAPARDLYDVECRLAEARKKDALRRAAGKPTGAQEWASHVFGDETPSRPQNPPSTSSPTDTPPDYADAHAQATQAASQFQEPLRQAAATMRYAAHRTVSYATAAAIGALWWPIQLLLAALVPHLKSPGGYVNSLQTFVLHPGAAVLMVLFAGLVVYLEYRFFLIHTVRTTPDPRERYIAPAVVLVVFYLNVYLSTIPFAVLGALIIAAAIAVAYVLDRR